MKTAEAGRGRFSSSYGFLMASVGAAVGLGNIWGFPYRLGEGGGFVFLALYLLFVAAVGFPLMLAELKLGRVTGAAAGGAFRALHRRFGFVGYIGVTACFIVLCYYFYFGGLILREISALAGLKIDSELFWHLVFAAITLLIVLAGVSGGIEKTSRIMVPALVITLAVLAVITLRLPGAGEAVRFLFKPDFSRFNSDTVKAAMGQALFSLSLGQGVMITYGSYMDKGSPLLRHAIMVPVLDTATALLAAVAIMPAVFSFGISPSSGPALLFEVMPMVFGSLPLGGLLAFMFFVPVFFAALTSAVSMLETPVAALCEDVGMRRDRAAVLVMVAAAAGGLPLCIDIKYYYIYERVSQNVLILACSLLTCVLVAWRRNKNLPGLAPEGKAERFFMFLLKYVTPAVLAASALT